MLKNSRFESCRASPMSESRINGGLAVDIVGRNSSLSGFIAKQTTTDV